MLLMSTTERWRNSYRAVHKWLLLFNRRPRNWTLRPLLKSTWNYRGLNSPNTEVESWLVWINKTSRLVESNWVERLELLIRQGGRNGLCAVPLRVRWENLTQPFRVMVTFRIKLATKSSTTKSQWLCSYINQSRNCRSWGSWDRRDRFSKDRFSKGLPKIRTKANPTAKHQLNTPKYPIARKVWKARQIQNTREIKFCW